MRFNLICLIFFIATFSVSSQTIWVIAQGSDNPIINPEHAQEGGANLIFTPCPMYEDLGSEGSISFYLCANNSFTFLNLDISNIEIEIEIIDLESGTSLEINPSNQFGPFQLNSDKCKEIGFNFEYFLAGRTRVANYEMIIRTITRNGNNIENTFPLCLGK